MFCEHCIEPALANLVTSDPKVNIYTVKRLLASTWNAKEVEFLNGAGSIHGRTLLENALQGPFTVQVVFQVDHEPNKSDSDSLDVTEEPRQAPDSAREASEGFQETSREDRTSSYEILRERCIRQLVLQERRRDFMWAGFVVNDLLPSLGADKRTARTLFNGMVSEGVIVLSKIPNPNNPDFPSTSVRLNHDHPSVRRAPGSNGKQATRRRFPLGRIEGEPLSETIIRERR